MDSAARYQQLLDEIRVEFPGFQLIDKESSWLQRALARALALATFGGQTRYLTDYVTTLGARVYIPRGWSARSANDRYIVLRHERVHMRQFRRWSWAGMALAYLLLPLPIGLAWCRYRFERAAYEETLRAASEVHGELDERLRHHIKLQFISGAYGWMWPFPTAIDRWLDRTVATLGVG